MGLLSRRKGRAFEQWFARLLREWFPGAKTERGIQSRHGGDEAADVSCAALPSIHFECMHGKSPSIWKKLAQAEADRDPDQIAVVVVKRNREEPVVSMRLAEFRDLLVAYELRERERRERAEERNLDATGREGGPLKALEDDVRVRARHAWDAWTEEDCATELKAWK